MRQVVHFESAPTDAGSQGRLDGYRWFPGWTMLGFSALAQYMSGPGQSYSVAAFKEPMRATLGISETDYSLAYGVATVVSGLSLPLTGWCVDRFGARRTLPAIAAMLGLACGIVSRATDLSGLYLGFTLIRCLGQGAMTLVALWIVGEWFLLRRGFATAVSGLGSSISVMTFPLLNSVLIARYGWQTSWMILGSLVALALVGPAWWALRDRPEALGLSPDGLTVPSRATRAQAVVHVPSTDGAPDTAPSTKSEPDTDATGDPTDAPGPHDDSWSVGEVLRDVCFWRLLSVPVASGMIGTAMVFHQVTLLGSRGVPARYALALISLQAFIATIAALGMGWLSDRWPIPRLLAIAMALLATSVGIVGVMPHPGYAVLYAFSMGLHGSILRSAGTVVWVNYYGRRNQGTIRGVSMSAMILAAAVGPLPFAVEQDLSGGYTVALTFFFLFPLFAGLLVWTAPAPRRTLKAATASG